jgi:DNA-binding NtrC family response regulator
LEHAIERAAVLTSRDSLEPEDFQNSPGPAPDRPAATPPGLSLRRAIEHAERQAIVAALAASSGNRRAAAQQLGISLRTLFYKMQRYRIE